jgi:hypothetical protein
MFARPDRLRSLPAASARPRPRARAGAAWPLGAAPLAAALLAGLGACTLRPFDLTDYDAGVIIADAWVGDLTGERRDASAAPGDAAVVGVDGAPPADAGELGADVSVGLDRPPIPALEPIATAARARVRFKGGTVLQNELAQALELTRAQVATELGTSDAFDVHRIALRGAEPYVSGIVEPIENTSVTTPLVVDRIVLSACRTRVDRDLAAPAQGVVFRGLPVDAGGALASRSAPEVSAAIERLHRRLLGRDPEAHEREVLVGFYGTVEALDEPRPARAWAIMTCFMVASSAEMLFY